METAIKLRDCVDNDTPELKLKYELKFKKWMLLRHISTEQLKEYEAYKAEQEAYIKASQAASAFFLNGVKFKNKQHLNEYLKAGGFRFTISFTVKGLWEILKSKFKKK